jgi:cell wall-associated NlpC family hydrolase
MLCKPQRFILRTTLTALGLGTFVISSAASADYGYYDNNPRAGVSFQQAAYQANAYQNNAFVSPPEILPYIPFDQQPQHNLIQPHQASLQNTQRSYQPAPVSYYQPAPRQTHSARHLSAERQRIIAAAKQQLGIKYRWGGNTPRQGFDCSGFTKHAMKALGTSIPRTAAQQSKASRTISRRDLKPGDMIFFKTSGRYVNHVGIYLGDGHFIHAASGGGKVTTDDLRKSYWQKRLHKYGTFLS